jgi:hypothetical protein
MSTVWRCMYPKQSYGLRLKDWPLFTQTAQSIVSCRAAPCNTARHTDRIDSNLVARHHATQHGTPRKQAFRWLWWCLKVRSKPLLLVTVTVALYACGSKRFSGEWGNGGWRWWIRFRWSVSLYKNWVTYSPLPPFAAVVPKKGCGKLPIKKLSTKKNRYSKHRCPVVSDQGDQSGRIFAY